MSHWDSLVAKVGRVVGGKPEKPNNQSPGLIGGGGNAALKCRWTWGWTCPGGGGGVVPSLSIFRYLVSKK